MMRMLTLTDIVMKRVLTLNYTSSIPASAGGQSIIVMMSMLTIVDIVKMRVLILTDTSNIPASA